MESITTTFERKAERFHRANEAYQKVTSYQETDFLEKWKEANRARAEATEELHQFFNILLVAGSLPPHHFDRYAPVVLPILQNDPFLCYDAGNQWSDANFHRYADELAKGIVHSPRLCYQMICDYLSMDSSTMDGCMLEQMVRESMLADIEKWSRPRIERIYHDLVGAVMKNEELGPRISVAVLQKMLEKW